MNLHVSDQALAITADLIHLCHYGHCYLMGGWGTCLFCCLHTRLGVFCCQRSVISSLGLFLSFLVFWFFVNTFFKISRKWQPEFSGKAHIFTSYYFPAAWADSLSGDI
jgi:hypothetical protein